MSVIGKHEYIIYNYFKFLNYITPTHKSLACSLALLPSPPALYYKHNSAPIFHLNTFKLPYFPHDQPPYINETYLPNTINYRLHN